MAPTEYKSTVSMPKALLVTACVLTMARFVDLAAWASSHLHPSAKEAPSPISWLQLKTIGDGAKAKARPIEPEISPEVQAQLDDIQKEAKGTSKILLYQFYASWSDPCKLMDAAALQNGEVAAVVDKDFLPVRVRDMQHEKGRNDAVTNALYKKYRVFAFPTLVAVREDSEEIGCLVGNCSSLTTYRFLTRTISSQKTFQIR
jgi:thiol:disulfide interchange protein